MTSHTATQPNALEEAIRMRAYLMWEADGRPHGLADHYWMRASEAEFAAAEPPPQSQLAALDVPARVSAIKPKPAKSRKGKSGDTENKRNKAPAPDVKVRVSGKAASKAKPGAKADG